MTDINHKCVFSIMRKLNLPLFLFHFATELVFFNYQVDIVKKSMKKVEAVIWHEWERGREAERVRERGEKENSRELSKMLYWGNSIKEMFQTAGSPDESCLQMCFVWHTLCLKQTWINCPYLKIGKFLQKKNPFSIEKPENISTFSLCAWMTSLL